MEAMLQAGDGVLNGVGLDTTTGSTIPGFTITFNGSVTAAAETLYQIWYSDGVPGVWSSGAPYKRLRPPSRRNTCHLGARREVPPPTLRGLVRCHA